MRDIITSLILISPVLIYLVRKSNWLENTPEGRTTLAREYGIIRWKKIECSNQVSVSSIKKAFNNSIGGDSTRVLQ